MRFNFFTFGGGQFWEDVFFYQKWRIQRHYKTKEFRLLDPWDIKRYEGGFEECRQAFVKYISIYQMPRQRGHMIIMLHGLADSKNVFKPMWRAALKENFLAAAVNFPSTRKRTDSFVKQLNFFLNHLEDVQEVSFISLGIGGIVLRKLLASNEPWLSQLKINRAVEVCPPNQGSFLLTKLSKFKFFRFILGPVISEMDRAHALEWQKLRLKTEVGVIYTHQTKRGLLRFLPQVCSRLFCTREQAFLPQARDDVFIVNWHLNPFKNKHIVEACLHFIKHGYFRSE